MIDFIQYLVAETIPFVYDDCPDGQRVTFQLSDFPNYAEHTRRWYSNITTDNTATCGQQIKVVVMFDVPNNDYCPKCQTKVVEHTVKNVYFDRCPACQWESGKRDKEGLPL